jgi:hypothetical protein
MQDVNWIELWLLNELVRLPRRLSHLLPRSGVDYQSLSYWTFPTAPALNAGHDRRIAALQNCVNREWIEVSSESWLHEPRFGNHLVPAKDSDFAADAFLDEHFGVLSLSGHEKWESDFQPDWSRFWTQTDSPEGEASDRVRIAYASDLIFDDLSRWFPSYWCRDQEIGLTQLNCDTYFNYQAGTWKVLPYVKVIEWQGQSDRLRLERLIRAACTEQEKSAFDQYYRDLRVQTDLATLILHRLSRKWECIPGTQEPRLV